jgi:hypothetical protein
MLNYIIDKLYLIKPLNFSIKVVDEMIVLYKAPGFCVKILLYIIILLLLFILILVFIPNTKTDLIKKLTLIFSFIIFILTLLL